MCNIPARKESRIVRRADIMMLPQLSSRTGKTVDDQAEADPISLYTDKDDSLFDLQGVLEFCLARKHCNA
jgi:hypothetical protein